MGMGQGPTEGGSGGKRGHSGMTHWDLTEEIKRTAKRRRRLDGKREVKEQSDIEPRKTLRKRKGR